MSTCMCTCACVCVQWVRTGAGACVLRYILREICSTYICGGHPISTWWGDFVFWSAVIIRLNTKNHRVVSKFVFNSDLPVSVQCGCDTLKCLSLTYLIPQICSRPKQEMFSKPTSRADFTMVERRKIMLSLAKGKIGRNNYPEWTDSRVLL